MVDVAALIGSLKVRLWGSVARFSNTIEISPPPGAVASVGSNNSAAPGSVPMVRLVASPSPPPAGAEAPGLAPGSALGLAPPPPPPPPTSDAGPIRYRAAADRL